MYGNGGIFLRARELEHTHTPIRTPIQPRKPKSGGTWQIYTVQASGESSRWNLAVFTCRMAEQVDAAHSGIPYVYARILYIYNIWVWYVVRACTSHRTDRLGFVVNWRSICADRGWGWFRRSLRLDRCWRTCTASTCQQTLLFPR